MFNYQNSLKDFFLTNYVAHCSTRCNVRIKFIKHVLLKLLNYFDYKTIDLKQSIFQNEY